MRRGYWHLHICGQTWAGMSERLSFADSSMIDARTLLRWDDPMGRNLYILPKLTVYHRGRVYTTSAAGGIITANLTSMAHYCDGLKDGIVYPLQRSSSRYVPVTRNVRLHMTSSPSHLRHSQCLWTGKTFRIITYARRKDSCDPSKVTLIVAFRIGSVNLV